MTKKLKIIALENLISQGRVECVKTYHKNARVIAYDFKIDKEFVIFCEHDLFIGYCPLCLSVITEGMDISRIFIEMCRIINR